MVVAKFLSYMALVKNAKICFRFIFFFHLSNFLCLKEILIKSA